MTWQLAVFAVAGVLALGVIAGEVGRKWSAIVGALYPGRATSNASRDADRWRRVHVEADRRATFDRDLPFRADGAGRKAR